MRDAPLGQPGHHRPYQSVGNFSALRWRSSRPRSWPPDISCQTQPSNAHLDETAYCYIGEDLVPDPLASDDDEFFERRVIPFREAVTMAANDDIRRSSWRR